MLTKCYPNANSIKIKQQQKGVLLLRHLIRNYWRHLIIVKLMTKMFVYKILKQFQVVEQI